MLGKTLILGLISAGAAGAIVYYGTAPQGSEALEFYSNDTVKAEKSQRQERATIEPRLPTVRKADMADGRKGLEPRGWNTDEDAGEDTGEDTGEESLEAAAEQSEPSPKTKTRWLDQYLKKNTDEEAAKAPKSASGSATNSYTVKQQAEAEDSAAEDMPAAVDPRTFRIENGKLVEIDTAGDANGSIDDAKPMPEAKPRLADILKKENADTPEAARTMPLVNTINTAGMANDSTPLLSTVMREAAEIKKSELRDQAYFEITEYALSEGRYDSARMAHDMIEQEELAYTAKSRIAVAFAQNGQPTKAFKVIGEVKEAELRDFMRLQVIEALIAPQRLPEAWQEKRN